MKVSQKKTSKIWFRGFMKKSVSIRGTSGQYKSKHYKDKKFLVAVGKSVRRLRISKGYSIDRLYLESGLSRATISLLERGLTDPTLSTLKRLADTIEVTVSDLISPD